MSPYNAGNKVKRKRRLWLKIGLPVVIILGLMSGGAFYGYTFALKPIDPNNAEEVVVQVEEGMNEAQIAAILDQKGLIRSAIAYEVYTRLSGNLGHMQSGTYKITRQMAVSDIVTRFADGEIAVDLITILPAQRLDQIREAFIKRGYTPEEVDKALDPSQYKNHPALADKPPLASLEGYLYPESFHINADTPLRVIVESSLQQMDQAVTNKIRSGLKKQGLSLHEGVILASIVEREVSNSQDRAIAAQVFLKRLKQGMPLGSDPTALYGARLLGMEPSVVTDTPYNTRLHGGLPPGPINNVSKDALLAVAYPANTDYLYFVSGDNGKTYFSKTLQQHEALTAKYCIELCKSY